MSDVVKKTLDSAALGQFWLPDSWLDRDLRALRTLGKQRTFAYVVGCPKLNVVLPPGGDGSLARSTPSDHKSLIALLRAKSDTEIAGWKPIRSTLHPPGSSEELGRIVIYGPGATDDELTIVKDLVEGILRLRRDRSCVASDYRELKSQRDELPGFHVRVSENLESEYLGKALLEPMVAAAEADGALLYLTGLDADSHLVGRCGTVDDSARLAQVDIPDVCGRFERDPQLPFIRNDFSSKARAHGKFETIVFVPLRFGGRLRGVACLVGREAGRPSIEGARRGVQWAHEISWALYLRGEFLIRCHARMTGISQADARIAEMIVGESAAVQRLRAELSEAAECTSPVLLCGETGTGKELAARAIHEASVRRNRPFVAVDCTSLVETLAESELFGHSRGSFTGASTDRVGMFEFATGGSLLIDEIASLPEVLQGKLLRVLESSTIRRVGANKTIDVDVRTIAASNCDLRAAAKNGRFRPDLYYRLEVFHVTIPPLRDRREDIPCLANYFLATQRRRVGCTKAVELSPTAVERMVSYSWPGNIRELRNAVERAVIKCRGTQIDVSDLQLGRGQSVSGGVASVSQQLLEAITIERKGFFEVVAGPLQDRNITRADAASVVEWAVEQGKGVYKQGAQFLNIQSNDYQRWMDFVRHHGLRPKRGVE